MQVGYCVSPDSMQMHGVARPPQVSGCICESALLENFNISSGTNASQSTGTSVASSGVATGNIIVLPVNVTVGSGRMASGARFEIIREGSGKIRVSLPYTYFKRSGALWCKLKRANSTRTRRVLTNVFSVPISIKMDPIRNARVNIQDVDVSFQAYIYIYIYICIYVSFNDHLPPHRE